MRSLSTAARLFTAGSIVVAGGGAGAATDVDCDIVIAGGSTASLAAAITAAEAAPELTVCFTEITDWPGGQMTAGGVPAIDFDGPNTLPENQPASFRDAMAFIPGDGHEHTATEGSGSPGACSVSTKCYPPDEFVRGWVMPRLARTQGKNLRVFLRTAVVGADRSSDGTFLALHAVQRTSRAGGPPEWSQRLSDELPDWYDPADSAAFTKNQLTLRGRVFVEATEMGDVLASSGLPWLQGPETPYENSTAVDESCGQAQSLTFYATLLDGPAPAPSPEQPAIPPGADNGDPINVLTLAEFDHAWTWRRSWVPPGGNTSLFAVNTGDVTQQNNAQQDLHVAYLLQTPQAAKAGLRSRRTSRGGTNGTGDVIVTTTDGWAGGVNLTALRMMEDRNYLFFHVLVNSSGQFDPSWPARLAVNRTTSGTRHGLSKMIYWRGTRRAVGVDGFKLLHTELRDTDPSQPTGVPFYDAVALGDYNDDVHHLTVCQLPPYMQSGGEGGKPYFIPFRALMVGGAPNLLAAGKSMAQSFRANANTRLHPSEWTTGVAAGGAAVLMLRRGWTSTGEVLGNISDVRAFLNSSAVGQPLNWTGLQPMDIPVGATCVLGRCLSVDAAAAKQAPGPVYNSTTGCPAVAATDGDDVGNCAQLASWEWLANKEFWTAPADSVITAVQATALKKSTANSGSLPSDQVKRVRAGDSCRLTNTSQFAGYWLCAVDHQ